MRVVLLSYEYPPDTGFGGIGTYTWYQARALAQLGHHVRVVAGSLEPGVFHSEKEGVKLTRVLDDGSLSGAIDAMSDDGLGWAPIRLRNATSAYGVVRDLLGHENIDMVEYPECGGDGIMISTMLPVKTCVRFHSPAQLIMGSYGADDRDLATTSFLERIAVNEADVRTSPSNFLADEVVRTMGVQPPVHIVANGIDLDLFDRADDVDVVDRFGLPENGAVTILWSSRLERRKGAHLLPAICQEILRRYRQVHVVVAGADDDDVVGRTVRPVLEADGVGHRLHALGRLPLHDVRSLVKHVDIHLLPSLWDNAPYSCIEAMASGRAVVTSDAGGLPELIDHERNGLVAASDDVASVVDALSRLVEDPALRDRLGAAARQTVVERHTALDVAERTVQVWRNAMTPERSA